MSAGRLVCWIGVIVVGSLCSVCSLFAQTEPQAEPLAEALLPVIRLHAGEVAVAVKHLKTGESFEYRATEPMPTASLIKFPVMIEAYRQITAGTLKREDLLTLQESDKAPGSGILTTHFSAGMSLSLRDAIRLMMAYSDNTATNLVIGKIGLPATSAQMDVLKCPNTRLHAFVFRGETSIAPERSKQFGLGSTSAKEMVHLLELLHTNQLGTPEVCAEMHEHMLACQDKDRFPALLPATIKIAHKTGAVDAIRTDAGLMETPSGTIAICVLTAKNQDRRWTPDNAGNVLCARIARLVYDRFHPEGEEPDLSDPRELRVGDGGVWVEILQRTLNARLKPSPNLSVDGDFGPTTQKFVQQFQTAQKLDATGVVAEATWKALAPLITDDPVVPEPSVVNQEVLPRQPVDAICQPPLVSAKGWAIGDAVSGEVLFDGAGDQKREMASTTKIMTAYVVLKLAEKHPGLLDEVVTFSKRADQTPGSTAAVRVGEQVVVRELLYGLMLPSGNDASVALAEHCGNRCEPPAETPELKDPLLRFVAEMNRTATQLGLSKTHFMNPHGLPHAEHYTTPRDLFRLGVFAWQLPQLREITGTRQYGCQLKGPGGSTRNIVWKNTNKLLEIEGYQGLKTGTTTPAGACLVSYGERNGQALIIVTLGSSTEETRYLDTRNLYRWAWQQRGLTDGN